MFWCPYIWGIFTSYYIAIWIISVAAIAGVISRPFRIPEAVWAVLGAVVLVGCQLLPWKDAMSGIAKGTDVYLFLLGMMLLSEVAREERLFDWLAAQATLHAAGSAKRLFLLIYGVGAFVTILLSNDATAVVLTPAVAAAMRAARVERPLPYLLICAFIANAASFVLPISNPANLVIYGSSMPPLLVWLPRFMLPSLLSIGFTYGLLYYTQRGSLPGSLQKDIIVPPLSPTGRLAAFGIAATALVLLAASALGVQLGWPTAVTGLLTSTVILLKARKGPLSILKGISWSVLPLVAGLFVIVEALNRTGLIRGLAHWLEGTNPARAAWLGGVGIAFLGNAMNNLPAGLIVADAMHNARIPEIVRSSVLIGVDLGPNLSVTGSLATILWLTALRREGLQIGGWTFLKYGLVVMIPALLAALAVAWI